MATIRALDSSSGKVSAMINFMSRRIKDPKFSSAKPINDPSVAEALIKNMLSDTDSFELGKLKDIKISKNALDLAIEKLEIEGYIQIKRGRVYKI